jgi:hypothetical protein
MNVAQGAGRKAQGEWESHHFALRLWPYALSLLLRLIPQDLRALHLKLFAVPSIFGVLRGDDA